jgi:hypothetical protein
VNGGMEDWAYAAGWENKYNVDKPVNVIINLVNFLGFLLKFII